MKISFFLRLLPLGGAACASMAMAQFPGVFTTTGNMTTERMSHTATLLTNGRVLIAGGLAWLANFPVWASAELYDPATGTFTATGIMTTARRAHTATLLPNGKVLIAGGASCADSCHGDYGLASAELYDPSTGEFTATGDMTTGRLEHTATLLNNGRVLIAGGDGSAELYDPSTETFSVTGAMTTARALHTATLLNNGKVLIDSGYNLIDNRYNALENAELYDPDSGTFSLAGTTAYPGSGLRAATASLLTNGKVLVTLEYRDAGEVASQFAELYDPPAGTFTATGNMTGMRLSSTATLLPDGEVLIAGRDYAHSGGSAELYDAVTGAFRTVDYMNTPREESHTATLLPDGTVLLSGGWVCCGYSVATALRYRPAVLTPAPVLSSLSGDGRGQVAILQAGTQQIASSSNPAVAGEALEIYGAGLIDGSVIPPRVAIGGRMAEVLFFGRAPGFATLSQVNVRVPSGVTPGDAIPRPLDLPGPPEQ